MLLTRGDYSGSTSTVTSAFSSSVGPTWTDVSAVPSDGEVLCDTKEIECIRHASSFSLETGKPNTLPATQPVPVYVATVDNGEVFIELN